MKIRTLIIDDEPLARQRLRRLLGSNSDVEIVAECENGPDGVEAVEKHHPDLLFLDVQMPGMDGFEVLEDLTDFTPMPLVIFVTGFDEYAVRAFEARALDYLLKPATRLRVAEAVSRAQERLVQPTPGLPQALLDLLADRKASAPRLRRFSVRTNNRITFVAAEEVDWIEAAGNYVVLHAGKTNHILRETMSSLESQLSPEIFLRASRSSILNLRRIKELQAVAPGENVAILHDGQRISMTAGLREVEERLRFH